MIGWIIYGIGYIIAAVVVFYYGTKDADDDKTPGIIELTLSDILIIILFSLGSWFVAICVLIGENWDSICGFFHKPVIRIKRK